MYPNLQSQESARVPQCRRWVRDRLRCSQTPSDSSINYHAGYANTFVYTIKEFASKRAPPADDRLGEREGGGGPSLSPGHQRQRAVYPPTVFKDGKGRRTFTGHQHPDRTARAIVAKNYRGRITTPCKLKRSCSRCSNWATESRIVARGEALSGMCVAKRRRYARRRKMSRMISNC